MIPDKPLLKWLTIGIGVKRWLLGVAVGNLMVALALGLALLLVGAPTAFSQVLSVLIVLFLCVIFGVSLASYSLVRLSRNLLAPYRRHQHGRVIDVVYAHKRRSKGPHVVAIGGGTGLPSVLRGMKAVTTNLTAVVTVADDGGSSGRLRRELGVLPPGDMRNNIAALADDEGLMTKLFQYRFSTGDLGGHAFGNLFIAALAGVAGGLEEALAEVERVLNIQGRVLPATLDDVNLVAMIHLKGKTHPLRVQGESKIGEIGGRIDQISLVPPDPAAFPDSVRAILDADLVVIGPGSLYTSILPNLLVPGILDALRRTRAIKVYVCNVATQPGETNDFTVADHVIALEKHIGRGVFQWILANNATPPANPNTYYVAPIPAGHDIFQRYSVQYTDLTDPEHPWRHDPQKLARVLLNLYSGDEMAISSLTDSIFVRM